ETGQEWIVRVLPHKDRRTTVVQCLTVRIGWHRCGRHAVVGGPCFPIILDPGFNDRIVVPSTELDVVQGGREHPLLGWPDETGQQTGEVCTLKRPDPAHGSMTLDGSTTVEHLV